MQMNEQKRNAKLEKQMHIIFPIGGKTMSKTL